MKKILFIACTALFAFSCNNSDDTKKEATPAETAKMSDAKPATYDYPYTLDRPYQNWQPGDQQHAVNVMKSLKAYETGDVTASMAAFGDSVELMFDYYHAKLSKDSLTKMFTKQRADTKSMTIKMDDWESVISSDKKSEWVTLWYKQIWTDQKGKTDSLGVINDAKIVNGKIVVLDEKIQHYAAAKK